MSRPLVESIDTRTLFAVLAPDLAFGRNGALPDDVTVLRESPAGLLVSRVGESSQTQVFDRLTLAGGKDPAYAATPAVPDAVGGSARTADLQGRGLLVQQVGHRNTVRVTRYTTAGTPDTTFGKRGVATITLPPPPKLAGKGQGTAGRPDYVAVEAAAVPDGGVVLRLDQSSSSSAASYHQQYLVRLTARGHVYAPFGTVKLADNDARTLAVDPQGRAVLTGLNKRGFNVLRYTADGKVDTTFGKGGFYTVRPGATRIYEGDITATLDAQGRVLLSRDAQGGRPATLTRLNNRGRPDAAFSGDGVVDDLSTSGRQALSGVVADPDGRLTALVLESPAGDAGNERAVLVRLNADGTRDTTLGTNGVATLLDSSSVEARLLARLSDSGYLIVPNGLFEIKKYVPAVPFALSNTGLLSFRNDSPTTQDRTIRITSDAGGVHVSDNGRTATYAASAVTSIDAQLGDGTNRFTSTLDVPTGYVGGSGDDYVTTGGAKDSIAVNAEATLDGYAEVHSGGGGDFIGIAQCGTRGYLIDAGTGGGGVYQYDRDLVGQGTVTVTGTGGIWDVQAGAVRVDVRLTGAYASVRIADTGHSTIDLSRVAETLVYGGNGGDTITTGDGRDRVYGGSGPDVIATANGNDIVYGGNGKDRIALGGGTDRAYGEAGNDRLFGGSGDDVLAGGPGNDTLYGETDDDTLYGNDGNDQLFGGDAVFAFNNAYRNTFDGGRGNDQATPESSTDKERTVGVEVQLNA